MLIINITVCFKVVVTSRGALFLKASAAELG